MAADKDATGRVDDLLFDIAILSQPLHTSFVTRVVGMTHAYVTTRYAIPPSLSLAADPVFRSTCQICAQGFADGTLYVDTGALRSQLAARHDEETVAKLMDFVRENQEVLWQWKNAEMFGPRPAMRCLEYAVLDFPEPVIVANYAAFAYVGIYDLERRGVVRVGGQERNYLRTVLTQLGNAACAIPFPDAAIFAARELRDLEAGPAIEP
jgi:hypothetical protein